MEFVNSKSLLLNKFPPFGISKFYERIVYLYSDNNYDFISLDLSKLILNYL